METLFTYFTSEPGGFIEKLFGRRRAPIPRAKTRSGPRAPIPPAYL